MRVGRSGPLVYVEGSVPIVWRPVAGWWHWWHVRDGWWTRDWLRVLVTFQRRRYRGKFIYRGWRNVRVGAFEISWWWKEIDR